MIAKKKEKKNIQIVSILRTLNLIMKFIEPHISRINEITLTSLIFPIAWVMERIFFCQ